MYKLCIQLAKLKKSFYFIQSYDLKMLESYFARLTVNLWVKKKPNSREANICMNIDSSAI